jgi:hypothetical protein
MKSKGDFDTSKTYMTSMEKSLFDQLLKNGSVTFFQTHLCKVCRAQIPKAFIYCSKAEFDQRIDKMKALRERVAQIVDDRWFQKEKVRKNGPRK